ncbi:S-layer homology domain-containing protein [Paenibacillus sp. M1]|uniref:S-layer homology domain-containing protein n=1 Tax=Paenibacillus haidiansis TaxID=1574488 RepID=A0ABU7VLP7_9BACL
MSSYKRTFRRSTKKAVSTMLVTAMVLGGGTAAFADGDQTSTTTQTTASSLIFSDVKDGFWAEKYIYKLASEGIILGDAGKFRPGDSVTQQEAVTMAIRFMNLDSKLGDGSATPSTMEVGTYFKPYVELAVNENLISEAEEVKATAAGESWGSKKATREWVAKLLVRALGKDAEAKSAAGTSTGFADQANISEAARGYVNVAVQLELTNGVEGNKFEPQGSVTRAQLATFFGRGSEYVDPGYSTVSEGIVTGLTDDKITLYVDGMTKSFVLDNRSVYFTKDSETKISKSNLRLYTKVMVVDKVGSAAYVEIRDPELQLVSTEGTLLYTLSDNRLLLLVDDDSVTYTYDSSTKFIDQNGNEISPEDLTKDSIVIVQRETFSGLNKPVIIQVKSANINKSGSGTVEDVDLTDKTISIQDDSGNMETFGFDSSSIMLYQNELLGSAGEIQEGASVEYTVKNSVITRLEITEGMERTVKGTLLSIERDKLLSYTNTSGKAEIKSLDEDVEVIIDGILNPTLDDLITDVNGGDIVELTLSPDDVITKIEVTGRQTEEMTNLTVVSYDSKYQALMVVDSNEKIQAFTLDDDTEIIDDSDTLTLSKGKDLLSKGKKISLTHLGDRVLSLELIYKYEGTFVSYDKGDKEITIELASGKEITLSYDGSSPDIEVYGESSPSLSDIEEGDPVTVILSSNQNEVDTLALNKTMQFKVDQIGGSNSRVRGISDGEYYTFYVDKAKLLDDNGKVIDIYDLEEGQTVNVVFSGQTATSLQVINLTYGAVESIGDSSLVVKDYSGESQSFSLKNGVKVVRGTSESKNISSLTTSDRVEVRKATDGSLVVTVLTKEERKVSRYDAVNKEIITLRAGLSDTNYRFPVSSDTYIHQGDTTISVQSLQENDKIVLYFDGDTVVEVEKQ